MCQACQVIGCSSCTSYGTCTTCSGGGTNQLGLCCNTTNKKYRNFSLNTPSCSDCHFSCGACYGPKAENCSSCHGTAIFDSANDKCSCSTTQWMDSLGTCIACPAGCLACTSATSCQGCASTHYQITTNTVCTLCPASSGCTDIQCCTLCHPTLAWNPVALTCITPPICHASCGSCLV
jgi:hypothetical protein